MPQHRNPDPDPVLFDENTPTVNILKSYLVLRDIHASRNDRDMGRLWDELSARMIQRDVWAAARARDANPLEMSPAWENVRRIMDGLSDDLKADTLPCTDGFIRKYLGLSDSGK